MQHAPRRHRRTHPHSTPHTHHKTCSHRQMDGDPGPHLQHAPPAQPHGGDHRPGGGGASAQAGARLPTKAARAGAPKGWGGLGGGGGRGRGGGPYQAARPAKTPGAGALAELAPPPPLPALARPHAPQYSGFDVPMGGAHSILTYDDGPRHAAVRSAAAALLLCTCAWCTLGRVCAWAAGRPVDRTGCRAAMRLPSPPAPQAGRAALLLSSQPEGRLPPAPGPGRTPD